MAVALGALALVVALLAVLVAGLLRSHAEILRSLHDLGIGEDGHGTGSGSGARVSDEPPDRVRPGVALPRGEGARAEIADLSGVDPWGEARVVALTGVEHRTLLAFLTSGCLTCATFWEAFADPRSLGLRDDIRPVIVAKGLADESPARVQSLAPAEVPTVMTSEAWESLEVPVAPYFILVDGPSGRIVGEGASASWDQVRELLHQAVADLEELDAGSIPWLRQRGGATGERDARADAELRSAGIGPGHPSLYPEPATEAADDGDRANP
jgi:hypothetical protein